MTRTGRIAQPRGGTVTVGPEERRRIKELRVAKGFDQAALAARVGVSQGTISNLESGRHPQIRKSAYAEIYKVLEAPSNSTGDEAWQSIVRDSVHLSEGDQRAVAALIKQLSKKS